MASSWQDLIPIELLTEIYKYLPRCDRLSCSMVCQMWKEALNRKSLWKKIVLCIDKDFLEPSTMLMTSEYYRHINSLEIGWDKPHIQNRWLPLKIYDLTKRVVRYMFILNESGVQLTSFKIFEWYDVYPLKKIIYHLARFLRIQTKLEKLVFHNTNLPKTECLKILDACMGSRNTVEYLEIHNYFYNFNTAFDTDEFVDYLRKFAYLKELKVDYFIFSANKVIDTIAENGRNHLKSVEIFIDETDIHSSIVPDRKWRKLKKCCPKVKVSISIKNICHYEQIRFIFLMKNIPLNSFSMHIGSKYNQKRSRSFEETLTHLLGNYWKTLEFINLDIKNNKENIDDLLFQIVRNCPRLKRFLFDGIINEDMNVLCEICRYKQTARDYHKFKKLNFASNILQQLFFKQTEMFLNPILSQIRKFLKFMCLLWRYIRPFEATGILFQINDVTISRHFKWIVAVYWFVYENCPELEVYDEYCVYVFLGK